MTFRARLTLGVTAAVAVAVLGASAVVYVVVRDQLRAQLDETLRARIEQLPPLQLTQLENGRYFLAIPGAEFGGASGYVQVANAAGTAFLPKEENVQLPITRRVKDVALGKSRAFLMDARLNGTHLRVLTEPTVQPGFAIMMAVPLKDVDAALARIRRYLVLIAAIGIGIAFLLATVVTRAVLGPVRRLTEATEHVAETRDLSRRMDETGSDELARLAASFNTMLEALDQSVRAQRQLVADASHELRTPLTSLRTNIEVLARSDALPPAERERLLDDVLEQLTEMSTLVAELVQLARGEQPVGEYETVRLDDLVAESVERARRNAPGISFDAELYESTVQGVPALLERAVGNLLDNAAKWSPTGGTVEVQVLDHEVTVRDHGPGIDESDLPFVFDRFYRAPSARGMPGSGLGLAIVRQVAESHGGDVVAERPADGGTRLRLRLPAVPAEPEPAVPVAGEA